MAEDRWAETAMKLEELRQQVEALKKQQAALITEVDELLQTFRSLAMHMGVVTEGYKSGGKKSTAPPTGFA